MSLKWKQDRNANGERKGSWTVEDSLKGAKVQHDQNRDNAIEFEIARDAAELQAEIGRLRSEFIADRKSSASAFEAAFATREAAAYAAGLEAAARPAHSLTAWLLHRFGPDTPEGREAQCCRDTIRALAEKPVEAPSTPQATLLADTTKKGPVVASQSLSEASTPNRGMKFKWMIDRRWWNNPFGENK